MISPQPKSQQVIFRNFLQFIAVVCLIRLHHDLKPFVRENLGKLFESLYSTQEPSIISAVNKVYFRKYLPRIS